MEEKLELLRGVPLFADLDLQSLEAVGVLAREVRYPAGHVLTVEGGHGEAFFVVADGTLRVERAGAPVRSMTAGSFLGEIALLEHGPRSATATCVSECRLFEIDHQAFDRLMATFPHLHRRIEAAAARRPRAAHPDLGV